MIKEKAYLDGRAVFAEEMEWLNLSEISFENPLIHLNCISMCSLAAKTPSLLGRFLQNSDIFWSNRSSLLVLTPESGVTHLNRERKC